MIETILPFGSLLVWVLLGGYLWVMTQNVVCFLDLCKDSSYKLVCRLPYSHRATRDRFEHLFCYKIVMTIARGLGLIWHRSSHRWYVCQDGGQCLVVVYRHLRCLGLYEPIRLRQVLWSLCCDLLLGVRKD